MSRKTIIAIVGRIATAAVIAALTGGAWWLWPRLRTGRAVDWDAPYVGAIFVGSLAVLLLAIWWLWWRLPKRQVRGLDIQIHDPKARADTEDNFRKTMGQALGGVAVLIGAVIAYLQFIQQQQASRDLLISNQVSKGFEQLGSNEVATRLGGIYALEGVMNTSKQYHQPVLEALCAFVRDRTTRRQRTFSGLLDAFFAVPPGGTAGNVNGKLAIDVQATLTVILRRTPGPMDVVDLSGANIPGADLNNAYPRSAYLKGTNLRGAHLRGADLDEATLNDADLSQSDLTDTDGESTSLRFANLPGTRLNGAKLKSADLFGTNLNGADLNGADLSDVDLSDTINLTQAQLNQACGKPEALPPGLTLKQCPAK
jgi:uncharacterized protein YjbI with pentapeptide repeats